MKKLPFIWSALIIVVLICAPACGRSRPDKGISIPSTLSRLIPPDTKALAGTDLEALQKTELFQRHEANINPEFGPGFDARRNIATILATWNGEDILEIARGRFSGADFEHSLASREMRKSVYRNYTLFSNGPTGLALMASDVAVAGPVRDVHKLIDLRSSHMGGLPAEIQAELGVLRKDDQIWLSTQGEPPLKAIPLSQDALTLLSNVTPFIRGAAVGAYLTSDAYLEGHIDCISFDGARRVSDLLRAGIGWARLTTNNKNQDLLKIYQAIEIQQDDNAVLLRANVPGPVIDSLLAHANIH